MSTYTYYPEVVPPAQLEISNLQCVSATGSSITISWSPPVNSGSGPVTGYGIGYREVGTTTWLPGAPTNVPGPSHTITGLDPLTSYEIRVRAKNGIDPDGPYVVVTCATVALLSFCAPAGQATYNFADPVHINKITPTPGSLAALQTAVDNASPGDWIVPSGNYSGQLDIDQGSYGTAANWVYIQPETLNGATITSVASGATIYARNALNAYIRVVGMDLVGNATQTNSLVGIGGRYGNIGDDTGGGPVSHLELIACQLHNSKQEGVKAFWHSEEIRIAYCNFYDLGLLIPSLGEGVYIGSNNGNDTSHHFYVENCWFDGLSAEAVDIKHRFEDAFVTDNLVTDTVFDGSNTTAITVGAIVSNGLRSTIECNRVDGVSEPINGPHKATGIVLNTPGVARYNFVRDCEADGIELRGYAITQFGNTAADFAGVPYVVDNNTVWNSGIGDINRNTAEISGYTQTVTDNVAGLASGITGTNNHTPVASDFVDSNAAGDGMLTGFVLTNSSTIPASAGAGGKL